MQITDLYQTQITCSTYNANIDSTNTVITVTLKDFNGAAVTNKSVTLTCDKGYFNKNGSTAISGTTTKSITATTNSSGQITATWTASEWGLCTFSANTNNTQIQVQGWRTTSNGLYTLKYNESIVECYIYIQGATITPSWADLTGQIIPSGLRPNHTVVTPIHSNPECFIAFKPDGTIGRKHTIYGITGNVTHTIDVQCNWTKV